MMKETFLFVYGTLLDNDNEFAVYLKNNSSIYAEGKVKGILYDIGEYPGAILTDGTENYIFGSILQLDDPKKVLPVIDDYEGFREIQPYPNEFIRVLAKVDVELTTVNCWIYLYNLPVNSLQLIESGRYIKQKTPRI